MSVSLNDLCSHFFFASSCTNHKIVVARTRDMCFLLWPIVCFYRRVCSKPLFINLSPLTFLCPPFERVYQIPRTTRPCVLSQSSGDYVASEKNRWCVSAWRSCEGWKREKERCDGKFKTGFKICTIKMSKKETMGEAKRPTKNYPVSLGINIFWTRRASDWMGRN